MDESNINKEFLRNLHLTVFPPEMGEFFGIAKVEALRGLAVVIVVATLLQRHGFFQGNIIPNSSSNLDSNPPTDHIYERASIYAGFTSWLAEYDPYHIIYDNPEEYGRLARFYHVCTIICSLFCTGKRLKRMYIFVGACLEGIPDEVVRIYSLGSERSELTRRRENIFTQITRVPPRKRATKPKNSNSGQKSNKRKRTGSSSSDDIQDGKTSKSQHESSENEEEDDYDDNDTDKTEEPQFESSSLDGQAIHSNRKRKKTTNEQITEPKFTLNPLDCYKNIAELID